MYITYSTQITTAQLTLPSVSLKEYQIDPEEKNMASIHFYFTTLSFVNIAQQPERLLNWLGNKFYLFFKKIGDNPSPCGFLFGEYLQET